MLAVQKEDQALKHFFDYHFNRLGVGLVMAMVGGSRLKFGVGKSYTAIKLGEMLDEDYRKGTTALKKIVHTPAEFVEAMDYIEKKGKKGQVIIIDESGILVDNRMWHSMINKGMSDVIMTFRILKCMAIFVSPQISVIDKKIRFFTNMMGVTEKVIQDGYPRVKMRLYNLIWDSNDANKYYYRPIAMYVKETQKVTKFKSFMVTMPENKELVAAYETKAAEYKRKVRHDMGELQKATISSGDYMDDVMKNQDIIHEGKTGKKVYWEELKEVYSLNRETATNLARRINRELKKKDGRPSEAKS